MSPPRAKEVTHPVQRPYAVVESPSQPEHLSLRVSHKTLIYKECHTHHPFRRLLFFPCDGEDSHLSIGLALTSHHQPIKEAFYAGQLGLPKIAMGHPCITPNAMNWPVGERSMPYPCPIGQKFGTGPAVWTIPRSSFFFVSPITFSTESKGTKR